MAGARPEPYRDADRILSKIDAVTSAMEKANRVQTRAAQKQTEIAQHTAVVAQTEGQSSADTAMKHAPAAMKAAKYADLAHSAYKVAKWSDPLGGAAELGVEAAERATGESSLTSRVARQARFGLHLGEAMAGHPVAIAKTVAHAPQAAVDTAMMPFTAVKSGYEVAKQRTAYAASGFGEVGGTIGGLGLTENTGEERGERQIASMGKASDKFLKAALGGTLGGAAGMVIGPPILWAKLTERLRDFSDHLHDTNMRFAEFSGSMMGVQVEQQIRDMQLSMDRGNRRASSAAYLAEGKSKLDRDVGNIEDLFGTIKNLGGGFFDRIAHFFMEDWGSLAESLTDTLNEIAEWLGVDKKDKDTATADIEGIGDKYWLQTYGKPRRHKE